MSSVGRACSLGLSLVGMRVWHAFRLARHYALRLEALATLALLTFLWFYVRWLSERQRPFMAGERLRHVSLAVTEDVTDHLDLHISFRQLKRLRSLSFGLLRARDGECVAARDTWQLSKSTVGFFAARGPRPSMEDRMSFARHANTTVFGVYDGHGGEFAANQLELLLADAVLDRVTAAASTLSIDDLSQIVTEEILRVDDVILRADEPELQMAGSTCVFALNYQKRYLLVANVGDSRGVFCDRNNVAQAASTDHKPILEEERRRIEAAGGFVAFNGVWRVAGILATSRALGDKFLKTRQLLIARPDVRAVDLRSADAPRFLVLASDGLWDVVDNQEAVDVIVGLLANGAPPAKAAQALTALALQRLSMDNVSVLIVLL